MLRVTSAAESGPHAWKLEHARVVQYDRWYLLSREWSIAMRFRVGPKWGVLAHDGGNGFDYVGRMVRSPGYGEVWPYTDRKWDESRACLSIMWRQLTKDAEH